MNQLIKLLTAEEAAAQLAELGCCPLCGKPLITATCPDCSGVHLFYCPTCQNTGKVTVCQHAPHRES